MKPQKNKKLFQRPDKILNGLKGIVYLMFLGRDTYAAKIQNSLVGTIYKKNSSVNQTVQRLLEHGSEFLIFQRKHREEGVPGRKAEIYTANFDPIFQTLLAFNVNFDKDELQQALKLLSPANDSFPQYLNNVFDKSVLRKASWHLILSNYFTYMSELIRSRLLPPASQEGAPFSPLPTDISIPEEKINLLLSNYPDLPEKFVTMSVKMSLKDFGLNPRLQSFLVKALPKIDQKLFQTVLGLQGAVDIFQKMKESGAESIMEYIERVRETEEFLTWKLEKEKKEKG